VQSREPRYSRGMETLLDRIERRLSVLIWMAGANLAVTGAVLFVVMCR
jgi:hypothetical protein